MRGSALLRTRLGACATGGSAGASPSLLRRIRFKFAAFHSFWWWSFVAVLAMTRKAAEREEPMIIGYQSGRVAPRTASSSEAAAWAWKTWGCQRLKVGASALHLGQTREPLDGY